MTDLFIDAVSGAVASADDYNSNFDLIQNSFADLGPWVVTGLTLSAGVGLAVTVAAGTASIGGRITASSPFSIAGLTNNTTNHLYMLDDGTGTSNTTGTQPADSVKLGTAVTSGGAVSSVSILRSSGRQALVRPENQVPGNVGSMGSIDLSDWNATGADTYQVFGTLPAGALPSIAFDDLSDVVITSGARGDILYRNATQWVNLPAGTSGRFLKTQGAGADPIWADASTTLASLTDVSLSGTAQGDILYRGATHWNNLAPGTSGQALRSNGAAANPSWSSSLAAMTFTGNVTVSAVNIVTDTTTGTQIGTGSTQKLGFFGATPIVQISGSTDILAGWVNIGLRGASSNPPLNMGSGALTCGAITGTSITVPGAGTSSEKYGASAAAAGNSSVAVGNSASAGGTNSVAVGFNAASAGAQGTRVGWGGTCAANGTSVGYAAVAGDSSVAIGYTASTSTFVDSCAIGRDSLNTANNQCVLGGINTGYATFYLGNGVTRPSPTSVTINATGGSGTDIAGASLTLAGGRGTGSGLGGDIIFQSTAAGASATTLRTLIEKMRIASTGVLTYSQESTVQTRAVLDLTTSFPTTTDASRKGRAVWQVYDTAARETLRMEASGTAAMLGFFGAAAVVKQTGASAAGIAAITDANALAAISALQTALANLGLVTSPA